MGKDGLNKVIQGEINDKNNFKTRKEDTMKRKWFWLMTAAFLNAVVLFGPSNNLYGEEKYTKEQLESDCELIGGTYEGEGAWGECTTEEGDSYFCSDAGGCEVFCESQI